MNHLHCYKFLKCIIFLSHICPRSLIKQTVSLYGRVCIYHKMLATAKSKKIDFDIGELFSYSPVPLDVKAELLSCLIWPESRAAFHGEMPRAAMPHETGVIFCKLAAITGQFVFELIERTISFSFLVWSGAIFVWATKFRLINQRMYEML